MSKYIELNKNNFKDTVSKGISLVDFWAPWCGPCKMLGPIIEEISEEFEGKANICKVNTDEEQDLSMEFAVRSIPTMIFLKDGEIVGDPIIGATSKQAIIDRLNALL